MNKLFYIITLLSISTNAQLINIKISDLSNNSPIDDADIYFAKSTKNFVSDDNGKAMIDLSNIDKSDEIIISKKDYQDAKINVNKINSESIKIRLEKVGNIELQEAFISNLKAEDILKKVIENYDKNFKVDEYYFLVDIQQKINENYVNEDYIDVNLQFKFDKNDLKIKSTGKINKKYKKGQKIKVNINTFDYLKNIYLFDGLKEMYENTSNKRYISTKVVNSKYAEKPMFEVYLNKTNERQIYLLVDKSTFSIVEFKSNLIKNKNLNLDIKENNISIKFRPHKDNWILKESSIYMETSFINSSANISFDYIIKTYDFGAKPFPEFKKDVKENEDIRKIF